MGTERESRKAPYVSHRCFESCVENLTSRNVCGKSATAMSHVAFSCHYPFFFTTDTLLNKLAPSVYVAARLVFDALQML